MLLSGFVICIRVDLQATNQSPILQFSRSQNCQAHCKVYIDFPNIEPVRSLPTGLKESWAARLVVDFSYIHRFTGFGYFYNSIPLQDEFR